MTEIGTFFLFSSIFWFLASAWMNNGIDDPVEVKPEKQQKKKLERELDPDDYWDEGEIYGTISSNSGATIRHPKNVDRAYSGSAERFHDGGW